MPNVLVGRTPQLNLKNPLAQPKREDDWRDISDAQAMRRNVFARTLQAAQEIPDLANSRHTLRVRDVRYLDEKEPTLAEQKQALLTDKSLDRRLGGTVQLLDNATQQVLDSRSGTLARVPYITQRGTMIIQGREYSLSSQMRLRPGSYTRQKENGEIENFVNTRVGTGPAHRYFLEPDKGAFYMRIGQAKVPLVTLLKTLGASRQQLQEAWGGDIYLANEKLDRPALLEKYYERLVRGGDKTLSPEEKQQALVEAVRGMQLDGEVTEKTLGKKYESLDLEPILRITQKLLAVSRGEEEVDDRDHLAFQEILGPEDLFAERLRKDYGGARRQLLWKASNQGSLKSMPSSPFSRQLLSAVTKSGLGEYLTEINPGEVLDRLTKVSRMGEGGIGSLDAAPEEARSVMPSHFSYLDALRTPESAKAGLDLFFAGQTKKGSDGRVYSPFVDVKTQQPVWKSPQELQSLTVAFPGELKKGNKRVGAMRGGRLGFFPRDEVDLVSPHFEKTFSPLGNLVPLKSGSKGQRISMAARMLTQSLPLQKGEAPFVQSGVPDAEDESYEQRYGKVMGAIHADKSGRVVSVTPDEIKVKYEDGSEETKQLYNRFPFNTKTSLHNTPMVAPGDPVRPGQLLAKSNFTDDQGTTALGLNARIGWLSYDGLNHEDAIVVSESFAKRATSEHVYAQGIEWSKSHKPGKKSFLGTFPGKYNRATLDKLDDDGVIRVGEKVHHGDPLVLAIKQKEHTKNKILKKSQPGYGDDSETWEHEAEGLVTDVVKTPKGAKVLVTAMMPMQESDKLSNRFGGKGIVSKIVPDHKMPQDAQGRPIEVALNPLGLISRVNGSQIIETVLGKITEKTGKPYKIKDFEDIEDLVDFAQKELQKHGIEDLETVYDPEHDRHVPGVLVGNSFLMKLQHTGESKGQSRGTGGYTAEGSPSKGGDSGSKRIGLLDSSAILAHGAYGVLRDASTIRGGRNEDYWLAFMSGHRPPAPKVPMVYEKFINQLKGSGINVVRSGPRLRLMALTNKDVDELTEGRELKNAETVRQDKKLEPVPGGLFDTKLTGGHHGRRWSSLALHEPMPSPVFEEPIRRLLGLTEKEYLEVVSGRRPVGKLGSGPEAIGKALANINVDDELKQTRLAIASGRKTERDTAVRRLGYLKAAQSTGVHPKDWMLAKVPVLPPQFRPVSQMGDKKVPLIADANLLYKELFEANKSLAELSELTDDVSDERLALYKAFKATVGLDEPAHPKLREKGVGGILKEVFSGGPKYSVLQRKLLSNPTDLVGRAVLSVDPDLSIDEVALPEEKAWEVYQPFIVRRLRRRGMPLVQALKQAKEKSDLARREMLKEMESRPVIANRAPVLHKFGMMALWPKLTKGHAMKLSPLVFGGYNADLDGDSCSGSTCVDLVVPAELDRVDAELEQTSPTRQDLRSLAIPFVSPELTALIDDDKPLNYVRCQIKDFPRVEDSRVEKPSGVIEYDVPEGVKILSYHEGSGMPCFYPVTKFSVHPNCKGFNVKTKQKREVEVSEDHSLYVYDVQEGRLVRCRPEDVGPGMNAVPVVKRALGRKEYSQLKMRDDLVRKHRAKQTVDVVKLDYEFGWWLGVSVSDAWTDWPTAGAVHLAKSSRGVRKRFLRCCKAIVPDTGEGRTRSERHVDTGMKLDSISTKLSLTSTALAKLMKRWMCSEGSKAQFKHLPPYFPFLPRACLWGVLAGLIDGDTGVHINAKRKTPQFICQGTTTSERLRDDIVMLCRILGIRCSITKYKNKEAWSLNYSSVDLYKHRGMIKLAHEEKRAVWAEMPEPTKDDRDIVPVPAAIANEIMSASLSRGDQTGYVQACSCKRGKLVTRAIAHRWLGYLEEDGCQHSQLADWTKLVRNQNIIWDYIESIEPIETQTMYDVTVPETKVFAANDGLIVYDTMQYHMPADDDAVKEAIELMMPSKNLLSPANFRSPMPKPSQEYVGGLYQATGVNSNRPPKMFRRLEDALAAFRRGKLNIDDPVTLLE